MENLANQISRRRSRGKRNARRVPRPRGHRAPKAETRHSPNTHRRHAKRNSSSSHNDSHARHTPATPQPRARGASVDSVDSGASAGSVPLMAGSSAISQTRSDGGQEYDVAGGSDLMEEISAATRAWALEAAACSGASNDAGSSWSHPSGEEVHALDSPGSQSFTMEVESGAGSDTGSVASVSSGLYAPHTAAGSPKVWSSPLSVTASPAPLAPLVPAPAPAPRSIAATSGLSAHSKAWGEDRTHVATAPAAVVAPRVAAPVAFTYDAPPPGLESSGMHAPPHAQSWQQPLQVPQWQQQWQAAHQFQAMQRMHWQQQWAPAPAPAQRTLYKPTMPMPTMHLGSGSPPQVAPPHTPMTFGAPEMDHAGGYGYGQSYTVVPQMAAAGTVSLLKAA